MKDKAHPEFSVLIDEAFSLGIVTAEYWWKSVKYITCEASIPPKIHWKDTLLLQLCISWEELYTWLFFLQKILSSKTLCGDLESAQLKVFWVKETLFSSSVSETVSYIQLNLTGKWWLQTSKVSASGEMWWPDLCPAGRGAPAQFWEQECVWVSHLPACQGRSDPVQVVFAWPALVKQLRQGEEGARDSCEM